MLFFFLQEDFIVRITPTGSNGVINAAVGLKLQLDCQIETPSNIQPLVEWSYEIGPQLISSADEIVPIKRSGTSLIISKKLKLRL